MNVKKILLVTLLNLIAVSSFAMRHQQAMSKDTAFTEPQKKAIEKIIHDYLVNQPEVLIEASRALQEKQQANMLEKAKKVIADNQSLVFSDKSPAAGNAEGKVQLVEFFDYQCKYCKRMTTVVDTLAKDNKSLKVIYKELPIFGGASEYAAKAALAANMQGKFKVMHLALMGVEQRLNNELVLKLAKDAGLDVDRLKKDMDDPKVAQEIKDNMMLAEKIGIQGTPVFIIASGVGSDSIKAQYVPSATSQMRLQKLIDEVK